MPSYDSVIPCCLRSGPARILRVRTNLLPAELDSDTEEKNISDRIGDTCVAQNILKYFFKCTTLPSSHKSLCSGKCETVKLYNLAAVCWLGDNNSQWRIW